MNRPACCRVIIVIAIACAAPAAMASETGLSVCAGIAEDAARLACYDALAGRGGEARSNAAAAREARPPGAPARAEPTAVEARWELKPEDKRGIFNLVPHRPLYILGHWTSNPNERPASPARPFDLAQALDLERAEAKIQLSFKTKMAEGVFGTPADLWFGYTQVSYWQISNRRSSSPFRETDYEPEATLVYPVAWSIGGLRLRLLGLTLNHQSNGRDGAFSRSWNRLIGEAAAEYGPWSVHVRPWTRVFTSGGGRNDNPDIEDFAGRGELAVSWRGKGHVVTATGRHTLRLDDRSRGSLMLDWAFPLVGSLNAHLQVFSGYGLNLIDYNHRQTTLGVGVSFFD